MDIGFIGLGKMGGNMVRRLIQSGHQVAGYDRSPETVSSLSGEGMQGFDSLEGLVEDLSAPRLIWLMVPAGEIVDQTIQSLLPLLSQGDIVIDGGNSRYTDTIRRGEELEARGIEFVDAGTSGGVWGLEIGYCLMVGASPKAFERLEPYLKTLAPADGYRHLGPVGAGHFAKMIHNGIEYGLMQAYAEGFELLEHAPFDLDLPSIAALWGKGSVIRSWLLELAERALAEDPKLEKLKGYVQDSGEGRWTVEESIRQSVPTPVITASLQARFRSRRENTYSDRMLAALRNQFGGHAVKGSD